MMNDFKVMEKKLKIRNSDYKKDLMNNEHNSITTIYKQILQKFIYRGIFKDLIFDNNVHNIDKQYNVLKWI